MYIILNMFPLGQKKICLILNYVSLKTVISAHLFSCVSLGGVRPVLPFHHNKVKHF